MEGGHLGNSFLFLFCGIIYLGWVYLGGEGYTFFEGGTLGYFFSLTIGALGLL